MKKYLIEQLRQPYGPLIPQAAVVLMLAARTLGGEVSRGGGGRTEPFQLDRRMGACP